MSAGVVLQFTAQYESAGPCWKCGIEIFMPSNRLRSSRDDGAEFFCPNGHRSVFTKTEVQRLKEELERQKRATEYQKTQAERAELSRRAYMGQVTALKQRFVNGVCPCCGRSFQNLRRHMATKHPSFEAAK